MKLSSIQTTAINAYAKFLTSGMAYGEAMRAAAQSLGGTPCPTFLGELAKVHATKYGCNYTWDGKGQAVFFNGAESTRETRHDAARKSWGRNVMVWFPSKAKAKAKAKPVKSNRLSKEVRKAAEDFLAMFDNVTAAKKALDAVA